MHVFYTPDIQTHAELPEEEAAHAVRVLRLQAGDEVMLTDGKGCFYRAEISTATNKRCLVKYSGNPSASPLVERSSAHCHGTYQEHGPYRVVCRESDGNRV